MQNLSNKATNILQNEFACSIAYDSLTKYSLTNILHSLELAQEENSSSYLTASINKTNDLISVLDDKQNKSYVFTPQQCNFASFLSQLETNLSLDLQIDEYLELLVDDNSFKTILSKVLSLFDDKVYIQGMKANFASKYSYIKQYNNPVECGFISFSNVEITADDIHYFLDSAAEIKDIICKDNISLYGHVLQNGGDLFCYDEYEKAIIIALPLATTSPESSNEYEKYYGNETILLVDDEDMILDVLIENLQNLGYNVLLAENGLDCVEIYRYNADLIDLVVLDIMMPKMNGNEAFHKLKEIDPNVKVLLSSGYMNEGEASDIINAGALSFLQKPYKIEELASKLRNLL